LQTDAYHGYAPGLTEFITKIRTGDSLFYSWHGGMGTDFYFSVVLNFINPLIILAFVLGPDYITESIALIYLISIPLIAASFAYFLKTKYQRNDLFIVSFSVMYGLSSYVTAYYSLFNWLPPLAILPFIALGLDKLIHTGQWKMYAVSLGLGILSNFMLGMFLCYFSVFYYMVECISKGKNGFSVKGIVKYAASSLYAGIIAAAALVPALVNMRNTAYSDQIGRNMPPLEFFYSIPQMLTAALHGTIPAIMQQNYESTPNIYAGMLAVLLTVLYAFHKNIPLRRRIALFGVLLFLLLASSASTLGWALNGLRYPAMFPHRFMFIYVFFVVMIAFESFLEINHTGKKKLLIASGITLVLSLLLWLMYPQPDLSSSRFDQMLDFISAGHAAMQEAGISGYEQIQHIGAAYYGQIQDIGSPGYVSASAFAVSVVLIMGFMFLMLGMFYERIGKLLLATLLLLIVFFEFFNSANINMQLYYFYPNRYDYASQIRTDISPIIQDINNENAFYRALMEPGITFSDGMLFQYNDVSMFGMAYGNVTAFMQKTGVDSGHTRIEYNASNPFLNALFGIKYYIEPNYDAYRESVDSKIIMQKTGYNLYENTEALPLGFMIYNDDYDIQPLSLPLPPYAVNNIISKTISGIDAVLYDNPIIPESIVSSENIDIQLVNEGQAFLYQSAPGSTGDSLFTFEIEYVVTEPKPTFVNVYGPMFSSIIVSVNEQYPPKVVHGVLSGNTLSMGKLEEGDIIKISVTLENILDLYLYKTKSFKNIENVRKNPLFLLGIFDLIKGTQHQQAGISSINVYQMNESVFSDVYAKLSESVLQVTDYNSINIYGEITVNQAGTLFLSIPYDNRWKAYINGREYNTFRVLDAFTGIYLDEGEYALHLKYKPMGAWESLAVSVIALLGIAAAPVYKKFKQRK
jgi:uncharacterized membrane protein YfhO